MCKRRALPLPEKCASTRDDMHHAARTVEASLDNLAMVFDTSREYAEGELSLEMARFVPSL